MRFSQPDDGDKILPVAKRRTVSIDKYVFDSTNALRSIFIANNLEMDFTTALNVFAEIGIRKIREEGIDKPTTVQVLKKYLAYDELKEYAIVDEWKDYMEFKQFKEQKKKQAEETTKKTRYVK